MKIDEMKAMLNGKADNVFEKKEKSKNKTSDEDPSERFFFFLSLLLYLFIIIERSCALNVFCEKYFFFSTKSVQSSKLSFSYKPPSVS